jgi:NAD(P)H-hydrate epimerase
VKRVLTAAEMKAVDAAAASHGLPSAVLMENAGRALAEAALRSAGPHGHFVVVCGTGHNGGDGLVAARWIRAAGRRAVVDLVGGASALEGEPARTWRALTAMGAIELEGPGTEAGSGDVVVDALLGTGLSRPPEGVHAAAIERIARARERGATVVAADVPSGMRSDTGQPFEACVTADLTVTFGAWKLGLAMEPGASRCGLVELAEIGIPPAAYSVLSGPPVFLLEESAVRALLPPRRPDSHKGTYGHVLVVAGSPGKTGAAALAALGALRGGAGLVTVAARADCLRDILAHAPEVMGLALPGHGALGTTDLDALLDAATGKAALVVGPGLELGEDSRAVLLALLSQLECPVVLDADGLNALQGHVEPLLRVRAGLVLTPHPGEMARLLGRSTADVQADRLGAARTLARQTGAVVVLKGARSVVSRPDGRVDLNPSGNPGMATGGTGDVLAGLIGALLAQGVPLGDAALIGTHVHGLAGDLAARANGQLGLIASDLLVGLGQVWSRWNR